jgi:hypothetical protein
MNAAPAPAPETSTSPDVVIGVDTHKLIHMAVALSANGGWLGSLKLDAKRSGYEELIRWSAEFGAYQERSPLRVLLSAPHELYSESSVMGFCFVKSQSTRS